MTSLDSLSYILSQTKQNIEFLVKRRALSEREGRSIISKLASAENAIQQSSSNPGSSSTKEKARTGSLSTSMDQTLHPPCLFKVKANWPYSVDLSKVQTDLTFQAGEIIEVVRETHPDWWTGRLNGREGLFPSNLVERLPDTHEKPAFMINPTLLFGREDPGSVPPAFRFAYPPPGGGFVQGSPMQQGPHQTPLSRSMTVPPKINFQ